MPHYLTVADPWFGSYVLCEWLDFTGNIQVLLGPLYQRAIRIERISNEGPRAKIGSKSYDKSCQHSYVEGSIVGQVDDESWLTHPKHWFPLSGGSWKRTTFIQLPDEPPSGYIEQELKAEGDETDKSLLLTVTFDYKECAMDDWVWIHNTCVFTLVFTKTLLTDGAVSYDLTDQSFAFTGDFPPQWQNVSVVASPFGEGGDALSEISKQLPDLIEKLEDTEERAGKVVTARDAAIYDALENLEIGNLNPIEELETLLAPLAPLRQLWKMIHGCNSFLDIVKNLASMHLFYKYVIKTGLMSIGEWKKMLDVLCHPEKLRAKFRSLYFQGRGRVVKKFSDDGVDVTVTQNVKLTYGKGNMSMLDLANLLGFTPRLTDLWDVVPYSFVLDWVIPIGDAINNMELNALQQQLVFVAGIGTVKTKVNLQRSFVVGAHRFSMNISKVSYDRAVWKQFPTNVWFGVSFKGLPKKQLLTGGALLIQFLKKD